MHGSSRSGDAVDNRQDVPGTIDKQPPRDAARRALLCLAATALLACAVAPAASAGPTATRLSFAPGQIVPIPASIPHEAGDMVDSRIVANLRWIARRYPIYVTDGYSGRLPGGGEHVGCHGCHTTGSDHHNGLAVDIVPLGGGSRCDAAWRGITRLALWAEPRQNRPADPFRWVGYDGDSGHGCGHHLHLSWEHAVVPQFRLAEWVEVFPVSFRGVAPKPQPLPKSASKPKPPAGPPGGISSAGRTGGVSLRGD